LNAVTDTLQSYADRGVFRGFRATPLARGRVGYDFKWLTRKTTHAEFDPRTGTIRFPDLLPAIDNTLAADVSAVLDARSRRGVPEHKRIDRRRARISGAMRRGAYSLQVVVRGDNHDYAVKTALNLINDMFVALHEHHPEYLIEQFGMSPE
jgi:hypothetical protein